jgi:gliding motility-associated-like protein
MLICSILVTKLTKLSLKAPNYSMLLHLNRSVLIVFLSIYSTVLGAQTLYWVGGSGNFNDPKHWSLSSGGASANQVPNSTTDLIFDDNSGKGLVELQLGSFNQAKGLLFQNSTNLLRVSGASTSSFVISGSVRLSQKTEFRSRANLFFDSNSSEIHTIDFSAVNLYANVTFNKGTYIIAPLFLLDGNSLKFGGGKYILEDTYISAGNIINTDATAEFRIKNSYFQSSKKFVFSEGAKIESEGMYVIADLNTPGNYDVPQSISNSKGFSSNNNINAFCPVTISVQPACSGPCTGVLTVSLSPSCTTTPYSVQVTNPSCPAFAAALSNTNIPSVYTVTNACACGGGNYLIIVRDGSNQVQTFLNGANFTPNTAALFPFDTSPSCSYLCDGILEGNIFGSPPFTVSVLPGTLTPNSFTSAVGNYSIGNACAGNYTFNITDVFSCVTSLTTSLVGPTPLLSNAITTSISCNGLPTGAYSISPTGGTPGYTVNFSAGSTASAAIGGGGTAATGALGIGPISATITDVNSCTLVANSNIIQPAAPITFTATQTNVNCNGGANGSATVLVAGGTPTYAYAWSPSASTSSVASGLGFGPQTMTITDQNACTQTVGFNITQPNSLTLTPNSVNVVCTGSATGAATVTAAGGVGPYNFTWTPASGTSSVFNNVPSSSSLTNLIAQNYSVSVLDANGCASLVVISITQPTPGLSLALTSQSITCFGANNGSATASPAGGNGAPFTFTWSAGGPPVNGSSVLNLPQGTHTVTVRDASLCPISGTVFIAEPATFTAAVTSSSLTCNSGNAPCNGSVVTTPIGGVAPFTYTLVSSSTTLTAGPSTTAASFTGICSNSYTINARDASNCPILATFSIAQPALLSDQATVPTMSCSNSTVTAVASATGGTSPYTFLWTSPPSTTLAGVNLPISSAGNYTVMVTDANSCTAQAVASVTAPPSLSITISTSSISCFNGSNGALSSTVQGGTPAYGYLWSNGGGTISVLPNINSLSPGNYTLNITDAQSCTATATGTVQSPTQITTTVTTSPVLCNGNSNGTATVLASGGTPGTPSYTYSVNFPTPVSNSTGLFTGQPSGVYTASVLDAAGCTQTAVVNITTPLPLTATITGLVGSCSANNGSASVVAAGGNGGYTYSWTPAGGTNSVALGLAPGNYSVTVTDASLCAVALTATVPFIVNISVSPAGVGGILCNGASTGSAVVTHTGGLAPFTYSWSPTGPPALTTSVVSTLSANINYTVRVTDANGCFNEATLSFTNPPAIVINTTVTHVTCFGGNNGVISTNVTGGVSPYTYTWIPGGSNSSSLSLLTAGSYTLNLLDANSCTANAVVSVTQSPIIAISFTTTNPTGCVSNNGSVCATASGGSGAGYTYSLTPPGASNLSGCFTNLGGGALTMVVTDGLGCTTSSIASLVNPTSPTLTILSSSVACNGASTGSITTTAVGSSPFTFSISPASGSSVSASPGYTASGLSTGIYFITAIDVNSCVTTNSVNILTAPALTLSSNTSNLLCNGTSTGSIVVTPSGGTPGTPAYTFSWLPGAAFSGTNGQGTSTVTNLASGNYTLNLTDGNACLTQHTFTLTQPPAITLTANTNSLLCNGVCNGSITVNAGGGTGALNYSWTAPGNPILIGNTTPSVTGLCANTGTFVNYSLTITDNNGCNQVSTYTINQPPALTHSLNLLNPSCSNSCNALATQTVTGGTPGYTFSWSSSAAATSTLGNLCAGIYTATATDAQGCVISSSYTVTPPPAFTGTLTPLSPLCNNGSNGSITSTLSGAQGTVNYVWSPTGSGANPINLSASPVSVYTLVATDQSLCLVTLTTNLNNPPPVLASVSPTNPICHNQTNGAALVSFTNATSPTTYTWLSSSGPVTQTAQSIGSLSPASYTVIVSDVNTCTAQTTFTLTNPPQYTVTTLVANSTCSLATGAVTVNVTGATPGTPTPYTYTWIAGTTGNASVVTNVASGLYSVQITDAAGCSTVVSAAVNDNGGPSGSTILTTSLSCYGNCNGSATLTNISGGLAPYTVLWQSPASGTNSSVSGLCAGDYSVEVTDANNCKFYPGTSIVGPSSITIVSTSLAPLCNGICDGSISVSANGGVAPYTYTWTSSLGGSFSNAPVQNSLCAGTYTLLLGNNTVCLDTLVFGFSNQSSLTIVPSVTNNACFGDANGAISVTVSGGNAPYTSSWSNSQNGLNISGLSNGSYSVVVIDAFGCQDTLASAVSSAPQLSLSTSILQPSCGLSNGSATASASGGTAPYTFTWSNSATTPVITGLSFGIYVVNVSDNSLCVSSQTVIVNNSNGITGENLNIRQIPCAGTCDGAATVTPIGGNPPYTINWVSPAVSGSVINNLCPGTYFVNMTDAQNCPRIASVSIVPLITLSVSPFIVPPSCGVNNGSVTTVVSGGNLPYTYTWTGPSIGTVNTPSITGLGAGSYSLLVTESSTNNCTSTLAVNLSNPNGPTISSTVTPNPCFGSSQASILTVGTGTGTISYLWSNTFTTSSLSNLTSTVPTVLTLTVSSSNGTVSCNTLQSFTLTDPPPLALNRALLHHPTCFATAGCDGSISVQALGGTTPYTYTWSNSATGSTLGTLCDGVVTLTLTDANNCTIAPQSYTLTSLSNISVSATSFSASCSSVPNGSISVSFSGGVPNYTVNWQGPGAYTSTNTTLNNIFVGDYIYSVIDSLGCLKSDTLTIAPTLTVIAVAGTDTILCPFTGTIALSGINSSGAESYQWYQLPNTSTTVSSVADYTVENLVDPSVYLLVVTSSVQSCFDTDTVFINTYSLPDVSAGTSTTIPLDATVQIGGNPTSQTAVSYTWSPGIYLNNPNVANPVTSNTFNVLFTVTVQDENFCIASDTIRVNISPEIYFTNAFSPNGDLKNDIWIIDYIEQFPGSTVEIYNRWGEQLFRTENYSSEPFDGKHKGQNLPVGTYYYIINLKTPNNGIKSFTGPLTIFR